MVSEGLLMDPPERLPLVLHGLLWDFPNMHATQGGNLFTLLSFLGIIPFLKILRRDFNWQRFSLWCKPGAPSRIVQEGLLLATAWTCPP